MTNADIEQAMEQIKLAKREYYKEYYNQNKEKMQAYQKQYRANNKDKVKQYNQNYWLKRAKQSK